MYQITLCFIFSGGRWDRAWAHHHSSEIWKIYL